MKDEYVIFGAVMVVIVCFAFAWCMVDSYTYENVTANITDKWEDEYTSMVTYSNGKSVWVVPVSHHDYWFNTTYGNMRVGIEAYNNYSIGDEINLTRNVNTTEVYLR